MNDAMILGSALAICLTLNQLIYKKLGPGVAQFILYLLIVILVFGAASGLMR